MIVGFTKQVTRIQNEFFHHSGFFLPEVIGPMSLRLSLSIQRQPVSNEPRSQFDKFAAVGIGRSHAYFMPGLTGVFIESEIFFFTKGK